MIYNHQSSIVDFVSYLFIIWFNFSFFLSNPISDVNKYFDFNLDPSIKNELNRLVLNNKTPELEIIPDDIDSIIPGKRDKLIELPVYKQLVKDKNLLVLGEVEIGSNIILNKSNIAVCQHYIKLEEIGKMSKKSDVFNQAVFDFVKQYIKQNNQGDNICKSCNELVKIHETEKNNLSILCTSRRCEILRNGLPREQSIVPLKYKNENRRNSY